MKFTPRPWQLPIRDFILDVPRCNIWADMGTGKTGATYSALDILATIGCDFFTALVIAPLRVARDVWPGEREKFDEFRGVRVSAIVGDVKERIQALNRKADVYTINYENIPWLVEYLGKNWPFEIVVADESTKLKGHRMKAGTKRAQSLAQIARMTKRWVNLTGTPSPNGLKDLWGQQWFIDFGERLGRTYTAFMERWFMQDRWTNEITAKDYAMKEIQERLHDCTLTIQMKDWMDLKQPITSDIYVNLPLPVFKQYRELEKQMFVELANDIDLTVLSAQAKSTKCLQFASGGVYYDDKKNWTVVHDEKLDALEEILEETAGANLLVFYWWKHDCDRILKRFPFARVLRTAADEKDWNAGRVQLMLAHPQSAGHGLNLQYGGHHLVWFSVFWNLEVYAQANERLGPVRQLQSGFDRPVYQYRILSRGTLDEEVVLRLETKADIQTILLNAMKRRMK